jgi:hypothetical protein
MPARQSERELFRRIADAIYVPKLVVGDGDEPTFSLAFSRQLIAKVDAAVKAANESAPANEQINRCDFIRRAIKQALPI